MSSEHVARPRSLAEIQANHAARCLEPRTNRLAMIVQRGTGQPRRCPLFGELTREHGLVGDNWRQVDRTETQISLIDVRVLASLSEPREWPLAGDNLIVDFELSMVDLRVGQKLKVGDSVLEVTPEPHLGCRKFALRFGPDALLFVNDKQVREQRRRGVYASVVIPGWIRLDDNLALV